MKKVIIAVLILLTPVYSLALDKKIEATNCIKLGVFDVSSKGNGISALNLLNTSSLTGTVATNATTTLTGTSTTFLTDFAVGDTINVSGETIRTVATVVSNTSLTVTSTFSTTASSLTYNRGPRIIAKIKCGLSSITQVDASGDNWVDESGGYYNLCANDTIGNTNEDECLSWTEGAGSYSGLIAKSPVKFKVVSDTPSATTCDILAATSGTSFTISTCTDEDGASITLDTDRFVGSYMVAYTNGGAQCNVVGHGVFVSDQAAGVITVKDSDMPGSGFPATPNTTNCGVRISP